MRIGTEHSCSNASETRRSVASSRSDNGFADLLEAASDATDATDASDPSSDAAPDGPTPELSAATYRLFAAIDIDRGDDAHADLFRARAADAGEAGLPLHPAGVLSDVGRWDYNEAAAAIPETGHFDTATGQGERTFIPYNTQHAAEPPATGCDPAADATAVASATDTTDAAVLDRLHPGFERSDVDTSIQAVLAAYSA